MGGDWEENVDDHTTTMAGGNKQQERAADDEVGSKEGNVGKGNGE